MDNIFERLSKVNVNGYVEQKNGLNYLSWAYAWEQVKKAYPEANYTIYENKDGWIYHTDGKTAWVKTSVTISGIEHLECLPVMNNRNQSIKLEDVTSTDVNKAIQRSLTKACARHGLGLYIYAGEDLPTAEKEAVMEQQEQAELQQINACNTIDELTALWKQLKGAHGNMPPSHPIYKAVVSRKEVLNASKS